MGVPPKTPATRASSRNTRVPATAPGPTRSRKVQDFSRPPTVASKHKDIAPDGGPNTHLKTTNPFEHQSSAFVAANPAVSRKDEDREPLKAYLRIRPSPENPTHAPYITAQSSTTVVTTPPPQSARLARISTSYTFTNVFPPTTSQAAFFSHVALPLVQDLMAGENALLFAYGVSGAGKTWTIQGGKGDGEQGLVWRVLRSVMGSVKGQQGDVPLKMAGKSVVADDSARDSLGSGLDAEDTTEATIKVDRNYTYSIFISYAEIYNEKIFDLLEPTATSPSSKRKALVLKSDPSGGGKYIHGLREVRVRTTAEAHTAFATGLLARQVSGTKVNHHSSRSHAIFSIRVVRVHKGRPGDTDCIHNSRLSIVDLAGSERSKATLATGDRLKESGSINKSLMVLGQCMEVLRSNQRKLAAAGNHGGGPVKLGVVPFRHSKLTELFQDFFVGEGRAVMVVNANPYDGGYDEIVNVMRFSALASQVKTGHSHMSGLAQLAQSGDIPKMMPEDIEGGSEMDELITEDDEEDEAEPEDPLVTHLFDQLEDMRQKLYEAEMRCAVIESETREEVTREMEGRMRAMERMFSERITFDAEQNEAKIDSKIDLVNRAMMASLRRGPDEADESLSEVEDQVEESDRESKIFLDDDDSKLPRGTAVEKHDTEQESQSDTTEEDQTSISELSDYEEDEREASDVSEGWHPSGDESVDSYSYTDSPVRTSSRRRSSAQPGKRSNVSLPVNGTSTSVASITAGKENERPKIVGGVRKTAVRKSVVIKMEADDVHLGTNESETAVNRNAGASGAKPRSAIKGKKASMAEIMKVKTEEYNDTLIIPEKQARAGAGEEGAGVPEVEEVDVKKKKRKMFGKVAVVTEEQILEMERDKDDLVRKSPGKLRRALRTPK